MSGTNKHVYYTTPGNCALFNFRISASLPVIGIENFVHRSYAARNDSTRNQSCNSGFSYGRKHNKTQRHPIREYFRTCRTYCSKIPLIGNTAISIAPLIGCPALLLLISRYFGMHIDFPPASFDILVEARFLLDGTFSFITGLDYLAWKTYAFLYLALTLGAGAAPSKTDIIRMLPGLIIIVASIYALNYFGVNILYLYNVFSWLSAVLTVVIIPLLAVTVVVAMLKLIMLVKSPN